MTKVEELRKQDAVQTAPGAPEASEAEVVLSNTVEAEDADIVDAYDLLERDDVPTDDDYVDLAEEDGDKPYETSVAMELELLDQESEPEQKPQLTSMFNATMRLDIEQFLSGRQCFGKFCTDCVWFSSQVSKLSVQ